MITPGDLLTIAEEINSQSTDEKYDRTAVSRAYYSAYHYCLQLETKLPAPSRGSGAHERLSQQLIDARELDLRKAGIFLRQLHGDRVDADYKIFEDFDGNNVELAINQVKKIYSLVTPHFEYYGIQTS